MKACWLTDIHLNFLTPEEIYSFFKKIDESHPDIILIGGDTGEAYSIIRYLQMFEEHFDIPIYFVLGNHDYYQGSISKVNNKLKKHILMGQTQAERLRFLLLCLLK